MGSKVVNSTAKAWPIYLEKLAEHDFQIQDSTFFFARWILHACEKKIRSPYKKMSKTWNEKLKKSKVPRTSTGRLPLPKEELEEQQSEEVRVMKARQLAEKKISRRGIQKLERKKGPV